MKFIIYHLFYLLTITEIVSRWDRYCLVLIVMHVSFYSGHGINPMYILSCFPYGSGGKDSTCNVGDPGFNPWVRKIPRRREWQHTQVFLPEKSPGQRSQVGYSPWGHKELNTIKWLTHLIILSSFYQAPSNLWTSQYQRLIPIILIVLAHLVVFFTH